MRQAFQPSLFELVSRRSISPGNSPGHPPKVWTPLTWMAAGRLRNSSLSPPLRSPSACPRQWCSHSARWCHSCRHPPRLGVAIVMRTRPFVASTSLPSGMVLVPEKVSNLDVPFRRTLIHTGRRDRDHGRVGRRQERPPDRAPAARAGARGTRPPAQAANIPGADRGPPRRRGSLHGSACGACDTATAHGGRIPIGAPRGRRRRFTEDPRDLLAGGLRDRAVLQLDLRAVRAQ
jgi:hypothetical protein